LRKSAIVAVDKPALNAVALPERKGKGAKEAGEEEDEDVDDDDE